MSHVLASSVSPRGRVSATPEGGIACTLDSPIGPVEVVAGARGLEQVRYPPRASPAAPAIAVGPFDPADVLESTANWLAWYSGGDWDAGRPAPPIPPLAPPATDFQAAVRAALLAIPLGTTRSYAEIAVTIGRSGAARAVGTANARNPIGVIVPCHRVIGARGTLTGYAGGLAAKARLLDHERGDWAAEASTA